MTFTFSILGLKILRKEINMKVAYILTNYPVLYNSFIINEMLSVKECSIDVIGLAMKQSRYTKINENSLKLNKNIKYFYEFYPRVTSSSGKILTRIGNIIKRRINGTLYYFIGRLLFGKSKYDKAYNKLHGWTIYTYENAAKYLLDQNVDIIHAGFGNRPATAAMILSEKTGIPFTFEAHAYDLFVDFPFANQKICNVSKIFTISNYNKKFLIEKYRCSSSKISVMRVPINIEYCDGINEGMRKNLQLITVCRLHPIKGLPIAIKAIAKLKNVFPDIKYILLGDGPLKKELIALSKKLDISDNVEFYGPAGNEEVLKLITESTMFILPSVIADNGDRDGIPTSLIEAMYLKTPVISTTVSGIPELIENGVEGYLVEPGNVDQLANKCEQLLKDASLCKKMGENGKHKVCNSFYSEKCEDILIREWSAILSND